jgi:hypothetical protein
VDKQVQFKLDTAEKFLSKIPKSIPKNAAEIRKIEENSEAFLFFASGVIELVKRQINDRFAIFDSQNVFYIHGLRKGLSDSGPQGEAKKIIARYFGTPKHTQNRIDVSKSSLWRLQALRNQAMHGSIIKATRYHLAFAYVIREGKTSHEFVQKTQSPQKYFGQFLVQLKRFTTQMCKILAKS